jgi:hypothetical protein
MNGTDVFHTFNESCYNYCKVNKLPFTLTQAQIQTDKEEFVEIFNNIDFLDRFCFRPYSNNEPNKAKRYKDGNMGFLGEIIAVTLINEHNINTQHFETATPLPDNKDLQFKGVDYIINSPYSRKRDYYGQVKTTSTVNNILQFKNCWLQQADRLTIIDLTSCVLYSATIEDWQIFVSEFNNGSLNKGTYFIPLADIKNFIDHIPTKYKLRSHYIDFKYHPIFNKEVISKYRSAVTTGYDIINNLIKYTK